MLKNVQIYIMSVIQVYNECDISMVCNSKIAQQYTSKTAKEPTQLSSGCRPGHDRY